MHHAKGCDYRSATTCNGVGNRRGSSSKDCSNGVAQCLAYSCSVSLTAGFVSLTAVLSRLQSSFVLCPTRLLCHSFLPLFSFHAFHMLSSFVPFTLTIAPHGPYVCMHCSLSALRSCSSIANFPSTAQQWKSRFRHPCKLLKTGSSLRIPRACLRA